MAFYDLSKPDRQQFVAKLSARLQQALSAGDSAEIFTAFCDEDTYVRKAAYQIFGKIFEEEPGSREKIIGFLESAQEKSDFKIRQTAINAAGEIGKSDFVMVSRFFDKGLFDSHHSVRNAVIGSVKKMGEVNPVPVLNWAKTYLTHEDKEIRREICHGIELRGRKHPSDILPLLKQLQHDPTSRVKKTLVHVLGQIAYKNGCLPVVVEALKGWENQELVTAALAEIIDVHDRYRNFAALTQEEAARYLEEALSSTGIGGDWKKLLPDQCFRSGT